MLYIFLQLERLKFMLLFFYHIPFITQTAFQHVMFAYPLQVLNFAVVYFIHHVMSPMTRVRSLEERFYIKVAKLTIFNNLPTTPEPPHQKKERENLLLGLCEKKGANQLRVNHAAEMCHGYGKIIVNQKFQVSSHLLQLYSPVCVRHGLKPPKTRLIIMFITHSLSPLHLIEIRVRAASDPSPFSHTQASEDLKYLAY